VDFYLKATQWEGELHNAEPHRSNGIAWFALDTLPEKTIPVIQFALQNIAHNKFFGEIGREQEEKNV